VSLLKPNWCDERVYDDLWGQVFRPRPARGGLNRAKKDLEPFEVDRPLRRKLIQARSEPRFELPRILEESGDCEETARFHRVEEMRGRLLAPFRKTSRPAAGDRSCC
jgi:hypothetical protein